MVPDQWYVPPVNIQTAMAFIAAVALQSKQEHPFPASHNIVLTTFYPLITAQCSGVLCHLRVLLVRQRIRRCIRTVCGLLTSCSTAPEANLWTALDTALCAVDGSPSTEAEALPLSR